MWWDIVLIIRRGQITWCKNIIHDLHKTATGKWATTHTPTVVSCRIVAVVIHDDPLTLCLAPFKLQIVLHTLFRTRKDHIVLFDVLARIICSNRSNSLLLVQTSACKTETAHATHATCDSRGDKLNKLTWKWAGKQRTSFSWSKRICDVGLQLMMTVREGR